jgi:hypothetical protein
MYQCTPIGTPQLRCNPKTPSDNSAALPLLCAQPDKRRVFAAFAPQFRPPRRVSLRPRFVNLSCIEPVAAQQLPLRRWPRFPGARSYHCAASTGVHCKCGVPPIAFDNAPTFAIFQTRWKTAFFAGIERKFGFGTLRRDSRRRPCRAKWRTGAQLQVVVAAIVRASSRSFSAQIATALRFHRLRVLAAHVQSCQLSKLTV